MISNQHKKETDEVMDIIFAMEQEFEEAEAEAKSEFTSLRDEIKNKVIIDLYIYFIRVWDHIFFPMPWSPLNHDMKVSLIRGFKE